MATHLQFPVTRRLDSAAMTAAIRAALNDPSASLGCPDGATVYAKKATDWSASDIAAAQQAIAAAPTVTPQLSAQRAIDVYPIELKALLLALIDQINVIRAALPSAKAAITPAQALQAVRDKAATL